MKSLFDQVKINNLSLPNRFVRSATWMWMGNEGFVSENYVKVYEELAKGGVGLITTGYAFVTEDEQPAPGMIGASDDKFIPGFKELTDAIHQHESKIFLQIAYGGSQSNHKVGDRLIWGPSSMKHKHFKAESKEMSKEDIAQLATLHADAALRAKKGGFDGVQFHCAHGYLLSQFLSPYYNRREDEYGGSIENRARIVLAVYQAMRAKVGEDYPITVKINCDDFIGEEGLQFSDSQYVCEKLAEAGIDAIEISGGIAYNPPETEIFRRKIAFDPDKQSYFSEYAAQIAEKVNVPVIVVGGNRDFNVMSDVLNKSKIELFSLSRAFLSEPDLVNKWKKDKNYHPKCVACNKCWSRYGNVCIQERKAAVKD